MTDKDCSFCHEEHDDYKYEARAYVDADYGSVLSIESGEWNCYTNDFNHVELVINYCPMCGRKLKGE